MTSATDRWVVPAPPSQSSAGFTLFHSTLHALEGCALRGSIGRELGKPCHSLVGAVDGVAVHAIMERILREVAEGHPLRSAPSVEAFPAVVHQVVDDAIEDALHARRLVALTREQLGRSRKRRRDRVRGDVVLLLRALDQSRVLQGEPMIHAEERVRVALSDGEWCAIPDLVIVREEKTALLDYKTSRRDLEPNKLDEQLKLYAAIWAEVHGGEVFELRVLHPNADKCRVVQVGRVELMAHLSDLIRRGEKARERGHGLVCDQGAWCSSCYARVACPKYWNGTLTEQDQVSLDLELVVLEGGGLQRFIDAKVVACPQRPQVVGADVHLAIDDALAPEVPPTPTDSIVRVTGAWLVREPTEDRSMIVKAKAPEATPGRTLGAEIWSVPAELAKRR